MRALLILSLALVVLAGCGDAPPDVDALVAGLDRGTNEERLHAAMGLAALGEEGIAALRGRLLRDAPAPQEGTPFEVSKPDHLDGRYYAAQGLGALGAEGVPTLLDVLDGQDEIARVEAQRVLAGLTLDDAALARLGEILGGTNVMAAQRAADVLGLQTEEGAAKAMARVLADDRAYFRRRAMLTGAQREDDLGERTVVRFLADTDPGLRAEAAKLAGTRIIAGKVTPPLRQALLDRLAVEEEEEVVAWLLAALERDTTIDANDVAASLAAAPEGRLGERLPGLLGVWGHYDAPVRSALDLTLLHGTPRAQLRSAVALAALLERARAQGEPWLTPAEAAAARETWAERVVELARASESPDADALLALGVFPEASAAAVPLLQTALDGDDAERALIAILAADRLALPARVALQRAIGRWRTSTASKTREAAEHWLDRHGKESADEGGTARPPAPTALRGPAGMPERAEPEPAAPSSDPIDDDGR